jgi:DNA-binding transcriptional regulator YhcF (GntR family)
MSGWIKLSKEINTHWIWKDPIKFQWWVDILLTVNYSDTKVPIGFKVLDCKRGETLMSLTTWAKRWGVSKSVVNNFFNMLEMDNMIETVNETVTTRLRVCNYDSYQQTENAKDTQTKRKRNANETQHDTIKEKKEETTIIKQEKEKETCFSFDEFWLMYKKSSDKEKCKEKYSKLSEEERLSIKLKLPIYLKTITVKKYQKNPLTYINGRCWNDVDDNTNIKMDKNTPLSESEYCFVETLNTQTGFWSRIRYKYSAYKRDFESNPNTIRFINFIQS